MRRSISLLFVATLVLAACGSSAATTASTPKVPAASVLSSLPAASFDPKPIASSAAPSSTASAAPDDTVWLCKPGIADNPCGGNLDATAFDASGKQTVERAVPPADLPIDCFYVYPTVSRQKTVNANLAIDAEERAVATAQAALFSRVCDVYAPMYPQLTLAAIAKPGAIDLPSALVAYNGVGAAWNAYLTHYNHGRGVVLIGHSQGAFLLTALIRYQIDPDATMRHLLVSALLMGGNVTVPVGRSVGGDFANIPACGSTTQTGCVVAYSSFDAPPPPDALFGRTGSPLDIFGGSANTERQVLCVNPAAPGGGSGNLLTYYPTSGVSRFFGGAAPAPVAATPFVAYPGEFSAHCKTAGGATWLQIDRTGGTGDHRPAAPRSDSPAWGLHVVDVNLALGNLIDLVRSEASARG